jgi:hypothetical protein
MNRSRWRMFLTVFLVVFFGGIGISGATALWSLQTKVTGVVETATWGRETGWPWKTDVAVVRVEQQGERYVRITSAVAPDSTLGSTTTYQATISGTKGFPTERSGPHTTPSHEFRIIKNDGSIVYTVSVTATVDGLTSAPVSTSFRVDPNGDILPPAS